ncbi:MAG: LPS-assembly protein LptD, partial [Desulfamplus sp.]|nr:LPS-assembly protein LptD [Desulfamplus sp.]
FNANLTLMTPRGDRFYTRYGYQRNLSESIRTGLDANITREIKAFTLFEQNLATGRTIESLTGLYYSRPCWSLGISYSDTPHDRNLSFTVNLHGIGEFH